MNNVSKLIRVLQVLRIADEDGSISLTSVTLIVALVKFAMTPPPLDAATLGAILVAVAAYQGKKLINKPGEPSEEIAALGQTVLALEARDVEMGKRMTVVENRTNPNNVRAR